MRTLLCTLYLGCGASLIAPPNVDKSKGDSAAVDASVIPSQTAPSPAPLPQHPVGHALGTPGVWENVTPKGIKLGQNDVGGSDNYGVQDVLADPVRPSDLYVFACYQGVWKSEDYGMTWTQTFKGEAWGKPWGAAIDPNPNRDPATPPTMYVGTSGAKGLVKSEDGGYHWTENATPSTWGGTHSQEVYSVDVDPNDRDHVIFAFHEDVDVGEYTYDREHNTTTWAKHSVSPGNSNYPFFVTTPSPQLTRKRWLTIPQEQVPGNAGWTEDGGSNWTSLNQFVHHHGSAQIFDAGGGTLYLGAFQQGIYKSSDYGVGWKKLSDLSDGVVTATKKRLYGSVGRGWGRVGEPTDPQWVSASRDDEVFTRMDTPPEMVDGAKHIGVTYDDQHAILVAGSWHAGIWRYVEP